MRLCVAIEGRKKHTTPPRLPGPCLSNGWLRRSVNVILLGLGRAPYVLYGVEYIDLVSLDVALASQPYLVMPPPFFSNWLASKIWI